MKMKARQLFIFLSISSLFVACQPDDNSPTPTDDRDKFIASWNCNEHSSITGNNPVFVVHINKGTASDAVLIENFYGLGFANKATAEITVNDIDIPTQVLAGNTIHGSGSLAGNVITMHYTVDDGANTDTISATFTK
jgi:hypothetical protein